MRKLQEKDAINKNPWIRKGGKDEAKMRLHRPHQGIKLGAIGIKGGAQARAPECIANMDVRPTKKGIKHHIYKSRK